MINILDEQGRPLNPDEAMKAKIEKIDQVLKEMGYPEGYDKYSEAINDMIKNDFNKYTELLKRVNA